MFLYYTSVAPCTIEWQDKNKIAHPSINIKLKIIKSKWKKMSSHGRCFKQILKDPPPL